MIDTIKFRLRFTDEQYRHFLSKGLELTKKDNKTDTTIFRFVTGEVYVGSFDRKITIRAFSQQEVYIEFSLPKYHYGHNVYLLYQSQIVRVVNQFYCDLVHYFGDIPHYDGWQIVRLDICYAWRFLNDKIARQMLDQIKKLPMARKKAIIWDDSVMLKGTTYSVKFYMKKPEYYYHDFRELKKLDIDLAYRILDTAEGVLRYEITLRKKALDYYNEGKILYLQDIVKLDLYNLANIFMKKTMRGMTSKPIDSEKALEQLELVYKKSKARSLWQFWLLYFHQDLTIRAQIRQKYHRSSNWYNLREIGKAGVGIPKETLRDDFEFSIPSDIVVNGDPKPQRKRGAGSTSRI